MPVGKRTGNQGEDHGFVFVFFFNSESRSTKAVKNKKLDSKKGIKKKKRLPSCDASK